MRNIFFLFVTLVLTFLACKPTTIPDDFSPDYKFDYFPLEVGLVRHYEVDSVLFRTDDPRFDTIYTQIQEVITNILENNNGDDVFRIERSERTQDTLPWLITDIFTEQKDGNNIYRKEEDIRQLKLTFPPTAFKTWDGNAEIPYNKTVMVAGENIAMFKNWDYKILSVDEPEEINGQLYDNVLTLQLANHNDSNIEYRYGVEKYARGVGLVYRELWILDTACRACCNAATGELPAECLELPWELRADEGFILKQTIAQF